MKNLAIIPARSGSKRLPDKNIKLLKGKPLMAHSIEAALKSGCFSEIMVSTNSEEYAEIARSYGASVPFLRSEEMSQDSTTTWDSVREVLDMYKARGEAFDTMMLLQPTSPLRSPENIRGAYELLKQDDGYKAVVSASVAEHPWTCYISLPSNKSLLQHLDKEEFPNSTMYRYNGAIYLCYIDHFKDYPDFFSPTGDPIASNYIMSQLFSLDVDTDLDFAFAEFVLQEMEKGRKF